MLRHIKNGIILAVTAMCLFVSPTTVFADDFTTGTGHSVTETAEDGTSETNVKSYTWITSKDAGDSPVKEYTWYLDKDGDGTADKTDGQNYDVTLVSSVNSDGQTEWTYTFAVADDESTYYVYEEMTDQGNLPIRPDYTSSGEDGTQAIPQEPGQTENKTYKITNSAKVGNLVISKTVSNPDQMYNPNEMFEFTVTLMAPTSNATTIQQNVVTGTKVFGDTIFTDGVAKVYVSAGSSVTISDIPDGLTYKVEETVPKNYSGPASSGDTGTIVKDETKYAVFTNTSTYTPPERETTSFKLTKQVEDSGDLSDDIEFTFRVIFNNLTTYDEVLATTTDEGKTEITKVTINADEAGYASAEVSIKKGQTITFSGVPVDATYQVMETETSLTGENGDVYTPSYKIEDSNATGSNYITKIASNSGHADEGESLSTAVETVDKGEDITITYTNTIERTQSLTLTKKSIKWFSFEDKDDTTEYEIFAELSNIVPGTTLQYTITVDGAESTYNLVADEDGFAEATFNIKPGNKVVISGLPINAQYKFTEFGNSKIPSYEITAKDNTGNDILDENGSNLILAEGAGESVQTDLETDAGYINANENPTVTFINSAPVFLPNTGGTGRTCIYIIAGALTAAVIVLVLLRARQRKYY